MTLDEFQAMPALSASFPLAFADGAHWDELTGYCGRCLRAIEADNMKGSAHAWGPKRDPFVYDVRAIGYCSDCRLLTFFHYRMHQDMSMSGWMDGEWRRGRAAIGSRVRRFLSAIFR